jgi:hypothetical protein
LYDRFDQSFVDRDKGCPFLVIYDDIGEADEQSLLLINRVGYAVSHRGNEKVAYVAPIYGSDLDANFFAICHGDLRCLMTPRLASAS